MTTTAAADALESFLLARVGMTSEIAATAYRLVTLAAVYTELGRAQEPEFRLEIRTRAATWQAETEEWLADLVRDLPDADEGPFRLEFDGLDVHLLAADGGELVLGSTSR